MLPSASRGGSPECLCASEHRHLRGRTTDFVNIADWFEGNGVAVPGRNRVGPSRKFRTRPLKPMIGVTHRSVGKRGKEVIIFAIWCCNDHTSRLIRSEYNPL